MTTLLLLLGAVIVAGTAVAALLWRQLFRPGCASLDGPGGLSKPERPAGTAYRPMNRLLAEEDFCFLQGQARMPPELIRRLRHTRVAVLRLYLRDMRADFARIHALYRVLAPRSADPNFAALVMKEALRFHAQLGVLYAASFLPWHFDSRVRGAELVDALARLDLAMRALLPGWTPPALPEQV